MAPNERYVVQMALNLIGHIARQPHCKSHDWHYYHNEGNTLLAGGRLVVDDKENQNRGGAGRAVTDYGPFQTLGNTFGLMKLKIRFASGEVFGTAVQQVNQGLEPLMQQGFPFICLANLAALIVHELVHWQQKRALWPDEHAAYRVQMDFLQEIYWDACRRAGDAAWPGKTCPEPDSNNAQGPNCTLAHSQAAVVLNNCGGMGGGEEANAYLNTRCSLKVGPWEGDIIRGVVYEFFRGRRIEQDCLCYSCYQKRTLRSHPH